PNMGNWTADFSTDKRGVYSTSVPLPKLSVIQQPVWQQHTYSLERRDSGYASDFYQPNNNSSSDGETTPGIDIEHRRLIPPPSSPPSKSSKKKSQSPIYFTSTLPIPIPL